jgi:SNF2 family DNA or RNA helicase
MTSSNEDLDWIKSACAPDVYRQQPYIEAAESVRWAPLESLMEDTFGPRKVQELGWRHNTELLTRDTAATDDYAGIKSAHTTESGIPVSNEDIRPDPSTEKFEQLRLTEAMSLMREGAGAPSCHIGHEEDITDTPAPMTGFEGAITLWPHQLAGVSRLQRLLKSHLCALLAFEMGLGKTFVVIGKDVSTSHLYSGSLT